MKNLNIIVNLVDNCQDKSLCQTEATWEELMVLLSGAEDSVRKGNMMLSEYQAASDEARKGDKDGSAWIPCSVRDPAAGRSQANMDMAYLLVLDIDTGMLLADVKSRIAGFEAIIHSSYSHTPEKPKWRAFHLDDADRRFFVWEITGDRKPNEFYDNFIDWRDKRGGLAALMDHLQRIDLTSFLPKGNAPMTDAKLEMIRQSKSDVERWLSDALEDGVVDNSAWAAEFERAGPTGLGL